MSPRTPLLTAFFVAALGAALASCGGSTERDDGADAGSGGAGAASAGSGGKGGTGQGGTSGKGGAMAGGSGGGSTAGAGGAQPTCSQPAEAGQCEAYFRRFFHNPASGVCEAFIYGGCGGNDNNFETFEQCEAACGSRQLDACEDSGECVLRALGCCGACEPSQLADYVAINVENDDAYFATQGCDGILCGPCPEPDPSAATGPYFVATCEAGRCVPVDLRETEATVCDQADDCSLRFGAGCCEGCGGNQIIAVSNEAALSELVCPAVLPPCLDCAPGDPDGFTADCQAGRCVTALLQP